MKISKILTVALLMASFFTLTQVFGQSDLSIVGSCGNRLVGNTMLLDWTVGEPVVATVTTGSRMLSQGFHQPTVDTLVITALNAPAAGLLSLTPNPSSGMVNLQVGEWPDADLQVQVSDATGTIVLAIDGIGQGTTMLDLTHYSAGLYTISVFAPNENVHQLFRIFKYN